MDVLCTDKTGTLTAGVVEVEGAYGPSGVACPRVLELAAINAAFETGLPSPLDDAILAAHSPAVSSLHKRAEIPFDFTRKRVSTIVEGADGLCLITKGAFQHILEVCSELADGSVLDAAASGALVRQFETWSAAGIRVLAVATRTLADASSFGRETEQGLSFAGLVTFLERPKEGVAEAIAGLSQLGVTLKLITGDTKLVAIHVAQLVGLLSARVLTGSELEQLHDEALWIEAERTNLFVEVDPNQKERRRWSAER